MTMEYAEIISAVAPLLISISGTPQGSPRRDRRGIRTWLRDDAIPQLLDRPTTACGRRILCRNSQESPGHADEKKEPAMAGSLWLNRSQLTGSHGCGGGSKPNKYMKKLYELNIAILLWNVKQSLHQVKT